MRIIFFETKKVEALYPATLVRHAALVRCGAGTLAELATKQWPTSKHHFIGRTIVRDQSIELPKKEEFVLWLNSSLMPSAQTLHDIAGLIKRNAGFIVTNGNDVVAAYLTREQTQKLFSHDDHRTIELPIRKIMPSRDSNYPIFEYVSQLITAHPALLVEALPLYTRGLRTRKPKVYAGVATQIHSSVVFNTTDGPVLLGRNVVIEPNAYIVGPVVIGDNTIIRAGARLKHNIVIGSTCRIGGEVEESVIDNYTNKQHDGFLGHSHIGSWVNIGGGTSNSDLKNTYGKITMAGHETKQQFVGCVMADYVKTAINTSIMTGKVIGVSSALYGVVLHDVPSFTNAGTWLQASYELPVEMALGIQLAMYTRRNLTPTPQEVSALMSAYKFTAADRKRAQVRIGTLAFKE